MKARASARCIHQKTLQRISPSAPTARKNHANAEPTGDHMESSSGWKPGAVLQRGPGSPFRILTPSVKKPVNTIKKTKVRTTASSLLRFSLLGLLTNLL